MELKIENLYKSYRKKEALKDINLTVSEGVYGLLGENGAGKSTLMRILTTVDYQTKGTITLNGKTITDLGERYRGLVGYMPQDYNAFPSFTAGDFLEYMGVLKGVEQKILDKRIPKILQFVNLMDVADKKVKTFSGGMKRRLGIGQAIISNPKILILDEPTAGLDPKERIRFSNIISALSKNKLVLLSTHIISDIEAISNNVIIIRQGKIIAADKIDRLTEKAAGKVWEAVVDQKTFYQISRQRKIIRRKQNGPDILVRYAGEVFEGLNNNASAPTLEDFYIYQCI